MGSMIKIVASSSRLPLINRSRALAATQRCFISIINDGHGLKHNLHRVRNVAVNSISNFIYTNIMNRFGLFTNRLYCFETKGIKPSMSEETDECLYYYIQMNGVMSHDEVTIFVWYKKLHIEGVLHDESKATCQIYNCYIDIPEDNNNNNYYYLKYNMRGIKADFSSEAGELKLTIPKFNAAERMMNQNKDEAGEFSKLKEDAFIFHIKVNAI